MNRITATRTDIRPDGEILPQPRTWEKTSAVAFCHDWRGENPDPLRETSVGFLWSDECLYIRFRCRYRGIYVFEGGDCRRDELWTRDVAEIFIRPGSEDPGHYKEFEISPNGHWLDLDINRGKKSILHCDIKSRVFIDADAKIWTAQLAIPFSCLTAAFDPDEIWRLNLFRIEGREPNRFYSAWQPTRTERPNFHIPECFGELQFLA